MQRKPKGKLSVAITAALELDTDHPLFTEAKAIVERVSLTCSTDKGAREALGGIEAATWCRWKRRCGLEVKATRPVGKHEAHSNH